MTVEFTSLIKYHNMNNILPICPESNFVWDVTPDFDVLHAQASLSLTHRWPQLIKKVNFINHKSVNQEINVGN